jgi:hypothetical protein
MKKIILFLSLSLISFSAFSQKWKYCDILVVKRPTIDKYVIACDSGELVRVTPNIIIKDPSGQEIYFSGYIGALNYMALKGWEYVDAILLSDGIQSGQTYHYILRRKI